MGEEQGSSAGPYGGGLCSGGGCGTVFELSPNGSGWTEKVLYRFQGGNDGLNPNAGVVFDTSGNLYGNTWQGGSGGGGTVYELSPSNGSWTFKLLYSVPGSGYAVDRLTIDSSGTLYGVLQGGGANGAGAVFRLAPSGGSWIYTDLHDFTGGSDGGSPIGSVSLDSSGNIYGTALFGGAYSCAIGSGCGVIFEITP